MYFLFPVWPALGYLLLSFGHYECYQRLLPVSRAMQECRSSMYLNTQGKNKGFFSALFWSNRNVVRVVMMLKFLKLLWWEESLTLLNPNIVLWGRLQNTITHAQALSPREFTSYTSSTKAVTICTLGTKTDGSKSKDQKDKQNQIKEVVVFA